MRKEYFVIPVILFLLNLLLSCASEIRHLKGVSGPVEWEVEDARYAERTIEGQLKNFHSFSLVLKEIRGEEIRLFKNRYLISNFPYSTNIFENEVELILRPFGEIRIPVSAYAISAGARMSEWTIYYDFELQGKNENGQDVVIDIKTRMPSSTVDSKPKSKNSLKRVSAGKPDLLEGETVVPVNIIANQILVNVLLNKKEKVNLLLDTGASRTLITPDVANLLEINPPENTETHRLNLVGGKTIDIPFVNLEEIRVGEAVVKDLGVGVSTIFPEAYLVDGLLGADFLNHFLFTVDRNNSRMILKPQKVTRPVRSLENNAVLSVILLSLTDSDKFAANIKDRPIYKYLKDEFNLNFEQEKKIETLFMRADFELKRACDPGEKKRDLDRAWEDYFLKIAGGLKSILNDEQRSKLALEIKAAQEALDKADESERTWIADKYGINDLSRFSKKMKEAADSYL